MIGLLIFGITPALPLTAPIPARTWSCVAWDYTGKKTEISGRFAGISASPENPVYDSHPIGHVDHDTGGELEGEYQGQYELWGFYRLGDGHRFVEVTSHGSMNQNYLKIEVYQGTEMQPKSRVGFCRLYDEPAALEKKQ